MFEEESHQAVPDIGPPGSELGKEAVFSWETLGPGIYVEVTLTHTTCLSRAGEPLHGSVIS